jgi:hypothetical protein
MGQGLQRASGISALYMPAADRADHDAPAGATHAVVIDRTALLIGFTGPDGSRGWKAWDWRGREVGSVGNMQDAKRVVAGAYCGEREV